MCRPPGRHMCRPADGYMYPSEQPSYDPRRMLPITAAAAPADAPVATG
jgi:hypothetical protein